MPVLLDRVPIPTTPTTVLVAGRPFEVRAYQPVVWVTLRAWSPDAIPTRVPFPAVIDTGNNHNCLIPSHLFRVWTGLDPDALPLSHRLRINDTATAPCFGFNLRLHRGPDASPDEEVFRLQADHGIAVVPAGATGHRMPTIGLRCLCASRVDFRIDATGRTFTLSVPDPVVPARRHGKRK